MKNWFIKGALAAAVIGAATASPAFAIPGAVSCDGAGNCTIDITPVTQTTVGFSTVFDVDFAGMKHIELIDTDGAANESINVNLKIPNFTGGTILYNVTGTFTDMNGADITPPGTIGLNNSSLDDGVTLISFNVGIDTQVSPLLFHDFTVAVQLESPQELDIELGDITFFGFDAASSVGDWPAIPEPASLAIFGLGLASLGFVRRRRAA